MAEKWYIIEQFGKVGPFSLQDLLSGVERGDFDYSITVESESTQQRITLTDLISKKKKARGAKKRRRKKTADADATRIVPNENRHRNLEIVGAPSSNSDFVIKQSSRKRRSSDAYGGNFSYMERRHRSSRDSKKSLLLIPAMLAGGVISLALFYGLQKFTDNNGKNPSEPTTANIVDLPLDPDELAPASNFEAEEKSMPKNILDIKAARRKTNQTVLLGPLTFSKSELYRCRVKCKLEFKDKRGDHITGVFFAQAFKNKLLKSTRHVVVEGRISSDGREIYLQSISR